MSLMGCQRQDATSYSAPKETTARASAPAAPGAPAVMPVKWTAPAGWQEQPAGGMRVASFTITRDGQHADISVIPLGVNSELDNVNRWRGQVGLPPVEASKLSGLSEPVSIGTVPSSLYDMAGTDPQTKQPTRIVASILSSQGTTWFFKMIGTDSLVEQEKPAFKEFLKSVQFSSAPAGTDIASAPGPDAEMKGLGSLAGSEGHGEKPKWDVPNGWQEQEPTSIRLASFLVTGDKGTKADVSVITLGGLAGGVLANVNRWRTQVGLPPATDAELKELLTTHEVNGTKITIVDMAGRSVETGEQARLLAAIVPRSGTTWFYKMLGDDQLVAQQKPAFIKFVESARYPNA